jgi:uncharacterized protein (DUF305 family)
MTTPPGDRTEAEPDEMLDESQWFASGSLVAADDAISIDELTTRDASGDAGGTGDDDDDDDDDDGGAGLAWSKVIIAIAAFAFLGGAIGYLIGAERPPGDGSVDVGFVRDMIDHHDGAVAMARIALRKQDLAPITRSFAEEVVLDQQREIGIMDTYLADWGKVRGDTDRIAMRWMGRPVPASHMPGMPSQDQLDQLEAAKGSQADRLFLTLMRAHHQGGVHMAQYAAEHASEKKVRKLATRMATFQSSEINEYTIALRQLGLEN